jgi:hypothetical protein
MKVTPVKIEATDWTIYSEQHSALTKFSPTGCIIIGNLLMESSDQVVVALETFTEGSDILTVRETLAIPRCCVKSITYLEEKGG